MNSVQEVRVDDITIGFIARRSVILDIYPQDEPDGWMITRSVNSTRWSGNYPNRKEAREALELNYLDTTKIKGE